MTIHIVRDLFNNLHLSERIRGDNRGKVIEARFDCLKDSKSAFNSLYPWHQAIMVGKLDDEGPDVHLCKECFK